MGDEKEIELLESQIKGYYHQYLHVITPLIIALEELDEEYPVEILNEIRAIQNHLARYELSDALAVKKDNVVGAGSHIKRATMDCFKYLSLSFHSRAEEIKQYYDNVDLHLVDNGAFLPKAVELEQDAYDSIKAARLSETIREGTLEEQYQLYEDAYTKGYALYQFWRDSVPKLAFAKSVTDKNRRLAVIGVVVGVIGVIIGVLGYFH